MPTQSSASCLEPVLAGLVRGGTHFTAPTIHSLSATSRIPVLPGFSAATKGDFNSWKWASSSYTASGASIFSETKTLDPQLHGINLPPSQPNPLSTVTPWSLPHNARVHQATAFAHFHLPPTGSYVTHKARVYAACLLQG